MKKFTTSLLALSMAASMTVTAFADQPVTLGDGAETQTSVDQFYSITQEGETEYQDTMMVQVEWKTSVINSKYETKKTWNPNARKWDTVKNQKGNAQGEAEFNLTNYSSTAVNAEITFAAADNMASKIKSVVFTPDNDSETPNNTLVNIATPVSRNVEDDYVYADDDFTTETVKAVITLDTGVLNGNTNGAEKLGTYNIKISKAETVKARTGAEIIAEMTRTAAINADMMDTLTIEVGEAAEYFSQAQEYVDQGDLKSAKELLNSVNSSYLNIVKREGVIEEFVSGLSADEKGKITLTKNNTVSYCVDTNFDEDPNYRAEYTCNMFSYSVADGSGNATCSYYSAYFENSFESFDTDDYEDM